MSSTASQARRLPRLAPQLAQAAVQRARLTLVPRPRREAAPAARIPFVTLISVVLLAGVIGLLMFNTSMQQASFRETALEKQAGDLSARQEALEMEIQRKRDPLRLAREAQHMGMVIPAGAAGVLDLRTGKVRGKPAPAQGERLPLKPKPVRKPAALNPKPVTAEAEDTDRTGRTGRSGGDSEDARDGAANPDRTGERGTNGQRRR